MNIEVWSSDWTPRSRSVKKRRIASLLKQVQGELKSDETLFREFGIAFQTINNSWRNSKQKFTKFYDNQDHFSKPASQQWFPLFSLHELLICLRMSSYADVHEEILLWLIMTFITLTTCTSRTSGEYWTWLICADYKFTLQVRQVDFQKKFKHISARVNHCCHRPSGKNYQMTTIG